MEIHDVELSQMLMIADQASPGPYASESDTSDPIRPYKLRDVEGKVVAYFAQDTAKVKENQRFFATFHPQAIKRLIATIEEERLKIALLMVETDGQRPN